ncbi:hypothetical protein Q604_UNBC10747G0001, partial [human gut metagenome]
MDDEKNQEIVNDLEICGCVSNEI